MTTLAKNTQIRNQQGQCVEPSVVLGGQATEVKVAFVAGLRGEQLSAALAGLSEEEVLALLESDEVSRVVRIAVVSKIDSVDLLVSVACGRAASFVRRNALQRLDELQRETPLTNKQLEQLSVCLNEGELLAYVVVLMDAAGFDWCARCDERSANAMCAALYGCSGIHEEIIIDDAFAQLAHCRPDLAGSLRACSPERFLPQALEPATPRTIKLVEVTSHDNVA